MKQKIFDMFILLGERRWVEAEGFFIHCGSVFAKLSDSSLFAELRIESPEDGWVVYPN